MNNTTTPKSTDTPTPPAAYHPEGPLITLEKLEHADACQEGMLWFKERFPHGTRYVDVNRRLRREQQDGHADWLRRQLFESLRHDPGGVLHAVQADAEARLADVLDVTHPDQMLDEGLDDDEHLYVPRAGECVMTNRANAWIGSVSPSVQISAAGRGARIGSTADDARIDVPANNAWVGSSGLRVRLAITGHDAHVASSETGARVASAGDTSHITSSGDCPQIATTADASSISAEGPHATVAATGRRTCIAALGVLASVAAAGANARVVAGAAHAQIATTGSGTHVAATEENARIATAGPSTAITTTGPGAVVSGAGYRTNVSATGSRAVVACLGGEARVRVGKGGVIALAWHDRQTDRIRVTVGYVGEDIKADTWYRVNANGRLIETHPPHVWRTEPSLLPE